MHVATTSTIEDFRSKFVLRTFPFFGVLYDDRSETRIEVSRDSEGSEVIDFRSQGERLAVYFKKPEEIPVFRLVEPSPDVDLFLFLEVVHEFYKGVPEIPEYFRNGLEPEEELQKLEKESDRVIFNIIMDLETYVRDEEPDLR